MRWVCSKLLATSEKRMKHSNWLTGLFSRAAGVENDIARYMAKYNERQAADAEKEELRRKNKELQDAQIALQEALTSNNAKNE